MSVPKYPDKHDDNLRTETGATPIPKNLFIDEVRDDIFGNKIKENHKWEQFFWTKQVVEKLTSSLAYMFKEKTCCLMTPSLSHNFHVIGRDEYLLDIDKRFDYLPKFHFYDVTQPTSMGDQDFRMLVIDPPFFAIPIETVRDAVDKITNKNYKTKIIIAFLLRGEKRLRTAFKEYDLRPTSFKLEYASIKPNKWSNFKLYSNIDLPGIRRLKD